MTKTVLYKLVKANKIVELTLELSGDQYRTISGFIDGAKVMSKWTTALPKNVGKSNETSGSEQAKLEVEAKIVKKLKEGYSKTLEGVDESVVPIKPMLAKKWTNYKEKTPFPVYTQPKLDGIRDIENEQDSRSRTNNPFASVPHIHSEALQLLELLPENIKLDGELYNHLFKNDFERITELVGTKNPTAQDFNESEKLVQYHIYDLYLEDTPFNQRTQLLEKAFKAKSWKYLKLVDTYLVHNQEELDKYYEEFLEAGYEGQMIRTPGSSYQFGRTKDLLKRKEFIDDEFEIIEVLEGDGNRSGMAGAFRVKMKNGKVCKAGLEGGEERYIKYWKQRDSLKGLMATVRYQGLTKDGCLRFPTLHSIRNYE